ncbi:MAG: P-loop NTPase [Spirochaetaceae bacterium]|jgi:flagellar biosynthesis protein FlhG|nr:P-loop NTPase [Spirochaetaceae bacterium]GMO30057.1 MAG: P-loop NTPase [Termitinemataceae bacterium]
MKVLPVASGKGGVGKSLVAANMACAFAQAGKKVILADLDLGASNLHLIIGHRKPGHSLGGFLNDPKTDFNSVIAETDIPNLKFIPGDAEIPGAANLKITQRNTLIRKLLSLNTDILILDLGAGTHQSILDFFLVSGQGLIVSAPAVTATLGAYVFLKNAIFKLMYSSFSRNSAAFAYLEKLRKDGSGFKMLYLPKMLEEIAARDAASFSKFRNAMEHFHPRLILNMLEDPKDADVAMKIRRSCESYLGLQIEHLGVIYRDSVQDISLASRLPVIIYKPQSLIAQAIYRIADKIMQTGDDNFDFTLGRNIDESYQEALLEAEVDFENKKEYVEELLHSGILTEGDLVETVKTQHLEISKLKKENSFLKQKLSKAITQGYRP